jgi:DNA polymerase-1
MANLEIFKLLDGIQQEEKEGPTFDKHSRVLLIDGLNLFLRNFAVMGIVNESGVHVGGLGGFLRSLGSLINQIKPTSAYIVFDGIGSSTNRKNLLPEYKSNRNITRITNWDAFDNLEEENDSKIDQISRLIHYLKCLPVNIVSLDKVEADDIIAFLSGYLSESHDSKVYIVSADKDFIQLINENVIVYRPIEKVFYTPDVVKDKFQLPAENFIIYKTLLGDASDVVTGIKGLGEKKLIKLFPELYERTVTLEEIFEISERKYKEHIIYSRIVFERDNLEKNYTIMNLKNPLLDDQEKEFLTELTKSETQVLNSKDFLSFYNEDGLGRIIKNVDFWIRDTFKVLNSFK